MSVSQRDLDAEIEAREGMTIAEIFARSGEDGFRKVESETLASLMNEEMVLATGGGTPCFGDNMDKMRAHGMVVHLATELSTALGRIEDPSTRPLLAQGEAEVKKLYDSRQPIYRRAQWNVATDGKAPEEVAAAIESGLLATGWMPEFLWSHSSAVSLGERSYPVVCESGIFDSLGALLGGLPPESSIAVITDDNVGPLYGARCIEILEGGGFRASLHQIAAGEGSKSIDVFSSLCDELIVAGLDRKSTVLALGGGVVGDLAGFVAASLYRGVRVVQVPTTILAMTDSAIGGKTGINTSHGKNLVGAFWQPSAVFADPMLLQTLPLRERRAAFGELVKYGLLDGTIFPDIEALAPKIAASELAVDDLLVSVIRRCAAVKAAIVSADERESGLRATLNLGHTVGHAIEAAAGYGTLLHGEAVGLGLIAACRVSRELGLSQGDLEARVGAVLQTAGLDTDLEAWLRDDVLARICVDKKRTGRHLNFITVKSPGQVALTPLDVDELKRILSR
jgi:3-dehydroquinate synthase